MQRGRRKIKKSLGRDRYIKTERVKARYMLSVQHGTRMLEE